MAFEDIEAEIGLLLTQMQNESADRHELCLMIRQRLSELRAYAFTRRLSAIGTMVRSRVRGRSLNADRQFF